MKYRMKIRCLFNSLIIICFGFNLRAVAGDKPFAPLQVSDNGRFLVTADDKPFFWLGDTAWPLIVKSTREKTERQPEVELFFKNRAQKGFNVLQVIATGFSQRPKNAYGFQALTNDDFSKPMTKPSPENDYWDYVDYIVDLSHQYNIYLALLPVWGGRLDREHSVVKNPHIAYTYGHFLGSRYKNKTHIIWIMGGDPYKPGTTAQNPERLVVLINGSIPNTRPLLAKEPFICLHGERGRTGSWCWNLSKKKQMTKKVLPHDIGRAFFLL